MDPDGRFTIVIPLIDLTLDVLGKAIAKGLCLGGAAWFATKGVKKTHEYLKEQENKKNTEKSKKGFPDRPLPTTEDGVPIPDTNAPHTQLGEEREGKELIIKLESLMLMGNPFAILNLRIMDVLKIIQTPINIDIKRTVKAEVVKE